MLAPQHAPQCPSPAPPCPSDALRPTTQHPATAAPRPQGESIADLYDKIAEAHVVYPRYVAPSRHLDDLMHRLLEPDPEKRITSAEVRWGGGQP